MNQGWLTCRKIQSISPFFYCFHSFLFIDLSPYLIHFLPFLFNSFRLFLFSFLALTFIVSFLFLLSMFTDSKMSFLYFLFNFFFSCYQRSIILDVTVKIISFPLQCLHVWLHVIISRSSFLSFLLSFTSLINLSFFP